MVCWQSDQNFEHDVTGPLLRKYLSGADGATVDNKRRSASKRSSLCFSLVLLIPIRLRCMAVLRLIENMTMGRNAGYLLESTHGAGSPFAQRLLIQRLMDLEGFEGLAKHLAQVDSE